MPKKKNNPIRTICIGLFLICFLSCTAGRIKGPSAVTSPLLHAQELKDYCIKNGIKRNEIDKADSLCISAQRTQNDSESRLLAETAAGYYNLAVARFELSAAYTRIEELKNELAASNKQLNTYKELLSELEKPKNR